MLENEKINTFLIELDYLDHPMSQDLAKRLIQQLPDYFFTVPASSSGKWHPSFALGEGGLVRHTKMAVKIAHELLQLEQYSTLAKWHDEILIALLMHDGWKHGLIDPTGGKSSHTVFEHPLICAEQLRKYAESLTVQKPEEQLIIQGLKISIDYIATMIESHMGQWNTSAYSDTVLPKPISDLQKFVHLCDFLASRRWVTIESRPIGEQL